MDSILYDLFFEELNLNSDRFIQDRAYWDAVDHAGEAEAILTKALTGGDRDTLSRLLNAQSTIQGYTSAEFFVRGFRLGGRLTAEMLR